MIQRFLSLEHFSWFLIFESLSFYWYHGTNKDFKSFRGCVSFQTLKTGMKMKIQFEMAWFFKGFQISFFAKLDFWCFLKPRYAFRPLKWELAVKTLIVAWYGICRPLVPFSMPWQDCISCKLFLQAIKLRLRALVFATMIERESPVKD